MLEWDILNYLKKWRTNLRATRLSIIRYMKYRKEIFPLALVYHYRRMKI